jgi:hypothetical protein
MPPIADRISESGSALTLPNDVSTGELSPMRFYIRTLTTTGATAFDNLDAAVHQARATLKLQEKRGYRVTDEDDRKVIRDGSELVNSLWIEDEEGTLVQFIFP